MNDWDDMKDMLAVFARAATEENPMADETETDEAKKERRRLQAERYKRADEIEGKRLEVLNRELDYTDARNVARDREVAAITAWHEAAIPAQREHFAIVQRILAEQNVIFARIAAALEGLSAKD